MVSVADKSMALVSQWGLDSTDTGAGSFADWEKRDAPCLVDLKEILSPVVWTERSAGIVRTLIPIQFRGFRVPA